MFYKLDITTNRYLKGNLIEFPDGVVLSSNNRIEKDGWQWHDEPPEPQKSDFEKWEERVDAIKNLKDQANESPLQIRDKVITWYEDTASIINGFISDGNNAILEEVENSDANWWDMRYTQEDPSPREVAIEMLTPLVVG